MIDGLTQQRPANAERQLVGRVVGGDGHTAVGAEGETDDVHAGDDERGVAPVRADAHDAAPPAQRSSDVEIARRVNCDTAGIVQQGTRSGDVVVE